MVVVNDGKYSRIVATVYIFNLIFGSGALLLINAFWYVGYVLGTVMFIFLCFLSFITCTFVIESMSLACALVKDANKDFVLLNHDHKNELDSDSCCQDNSNELLEVANSLEVFEIKTKFELSEMARLFFPKPLLYIFFISMIVYLYGDLLIYLSIVGGSLQMLTCPKSNNNVTSMLRSFCDSVGGLNVFRIYITIFTFLIGSMIFFNVTKTKVVQFSTIALRWLAFLIMIVLAISRIASGAAHNPHLADFKSLPMFIGIGLYSFMCQHSLPSILFPIREKRKSYLVCFVVAMSGVLCIYLIVTFTGVFAFTGDEIFPVYTMNFLSYDKNTFYIAIGIFLQLFPVLALSSSYPIVGITLRENMKGLLFKNQDILTKKDFIIKRLILPACIIYPPWVVIMLLGNKVGLITGIVGSYAGTVVQYVIPSLLVYIGKKKVIEKLGRKRVESNFHKSPFNHLIFIIVILGWSVIGVSVITYFNIMNIYNKLKLKN